MSRRCGESRKPEPSPPLCDLGPSGPDPLGPGRPARKAIEERIAALVPGQFSLVYQLVPQAVRKLMLATSDARRITNREIVGVLLEELVGPCRRRDERAMALFSRLALCLLKTSSYGNRDDVIQDVIVNVLSRIGRYHAPAGCDNGVVRYLFRLAWYRMLDEYRRESRRAVLAGRSGQVPTTLLQSDWSLRQMQPYALEIREAVMDLPERPRTVFCMRHVEGLSLTDIAKIVNRSLNTVKRQYKKALNRLRKRHPPPLECAVQPSPTLVEDNPPCSAVSAAKLRVRRRAPGSKRRRA